MGAGIDPAIIAAILEELKKQSGVQGFGSSPIVPSIPGNQGPGLAPGAPTPGQDGIPKEVGALKRFLSGAGGANSGSSGGSGVGSTVGGGIGLAVGGPVGAGIGSALGSLGESLLSGGGDTKEERSRITLNEARAGQARSQAGAVTSRSLQELMKILLQGGTGRGG